MRACSACGRLYPDDARFCPVDGASLGRATEVPVLTDALDPRVGQLLLQRYQVRRVIADGGMGRVYEALDLQKQRSVAIKILHSSVQSDPVHVERFKREFAISRRLPHDYIAEVIEFSELPDGAFALVMEFLFGEELSQTLHREKYLAPSRIVRIVSQIASGLDEAHGLHFVHRDLKPDNIFLCQTREGDMVKVLDFGSAKDKGRGAKQLTVVGTTIGSPHYMSPEQTQGLDTLDHRADIWALGTLAYQSMTGSRPFDAPSLAMLLLQILTKEPAPASAAEGIKYPISPKMDAVLERALRKSPALRYASAGALADALGAAYGLRGSHKDWAMTPESELTRQIVQETSKLMKPPSSRGRDKVESSFFGGEDPLLEQEDSVVDAMRRQPTTEIPWWLYALVVVLLIMLVLLLFL